MTFQLLVHPKAASFLKKQDKPIKERITKKLRQLENNLELGKPLRYSNFWSLCVGNYRLIYEIDKEKKKILVLFIGHRKNIYDNFSKLLFF